MKSKKYSEMLGELETIVEKMNRGEIAIDDLGSTVKDAARLIKALNQRLSATETEIARVFDELEDQEPSA